MSLFGCQQLNPDEASLATLRSKLFLLGAFLMRLQIYYPKTKDAAAIGTKKRWKKRVFSPEKLVKTTLF